MDVQFLHVPCIMYIVHALKVVLEDVCTNRMCQKTQPYVTVKQQQNVTYRLPFFKLFCVLPKNVVQTSILMMINVFVLESLLVFPDLSFPLEYWICNYKKYMECRLYVQDRTQSNPDTRQTAVQCLRDGDLPCIENKNKRSQRKACLPLERQPIDGL